MINLRIQSVGARFIAVRSWFSTSWFSCRTYSERMSRTIDEPLPWSERAGYLFHHYWCFTCRHFASQMKLLHRCTEVLRESFEREDEDGHTAPLPGLSTAQKAALVARLEKRVAEGICVSSCSGE